MFSFINAWLKFLILVLCSENDALTNILQPPYNVTEMALYVKHFNEEYFLKNTNELMIVQSFSDLNSKYYFSELLSVILKPLNNFKLKLENVDGSSYHHTYAYYNVLFIDSYESFRKIDPGPETATQDFSEYYLIVLYLSKHNYKDEIQKIFQYSWKYYMTNVALLLKMAKSSDILLYTYYPFTAKACHKPQLQQLNRNKSLLSLKGAELYPDKFETFHNCTLKAALWNVPPYLTLPVMGADLNDIEGIEGIILNVLAKVLQFNIEFSIPPNNEQRGLVKEDGTVTGAIKMLNERLSDLSLGSFRCTMQRSTALSPSMTFYQTYQVFTVLALRQPWTSFEIITYPFDFYIWSILLALTVTLFLMSYVLEYFRKSILQFIYGLTSSGFINMNLIAILLGQSAVLLPHRNFARYVLIMWILLTLLLRSIYQGSLYEFLKSQKTLAPPDNVQQLTARKYKLIVNTATGDSFTGVPIVRDKLIEVLVMNITDAGGFPILESNPDKLYVTGSPKDFLTYHVNTHQKYGIFHVLTETIFSQQLCVYFTKHSYLVVEFDRILQNLRSFGLIDYWSSHVFDDRFLEEEQNGKESHEENSLTLTQLSGIIDICMYLYACAGIVFVFELIYFKLGNRNINRVYK